MIKWLTWIFIAALLVFGGWAIREKWKEMGGMLMGIGFFLSGFLIIYAAYKNLK